MSNKFNLNWSTMFSYMTYKAFLTGATLWAHVLDPTCKVLPAKVVDHHINITYWLALVGKTAA